MKALMLGNKAVARGMYEAGCCVVSSYPGTPRTEITEEAVKYDEIFCEWAPNEKVALEAACGASLAGRRVVCGPDLWLYWHGYDQETGVRHGEIRLFYEDPENNLDILEKYGVDYILVSEHERYNYDVMEDELARLFPVLYDRDGIAVYDARGRKG